MKALIIKNIPLEGPGTITEFLTRHSIDYRIIEAGSGENIPSLDGYKYLIVMGGPMAVYEMDKYPFLRKVALSMEKAIGKGIKVLGICLGAQLLAHVLGSRVYPGEKKEIGWLDIKATIDGGRDEVFRTLIEPSGNATVLQWHGDTFDLPSGAVRLASSELFKEQAFRYKDSYALQFHIEVTPDIVREWFSDRDDIDVIMKQTEAIYPRYRLKADLFYRAFFHIKN
ncbi:MAG: type 1 glutamine amidotransferase [Thermodesulfovibrionales bacterium]